MEARFANAAGGYNFIAENGDAEKNLCENYTQGIVMWIETKTRKRDANNKSKDHEDDHEF